MRPTRNHIAAGVICDAARFATVRSNHVDLKLPLLSRVQGQPAAIRRPARRSADWTVEVGDLLTVGAVRVASPDLPVSAPVGLKRDLAPVRGVLRDALVRRRADKHLALSGASVQTPEVVVDDPPSVHKALWRAGNRRLRGGRSRVGQVLRRTSGRVDPPESARLAAPVNDLAAIGGPRNAGHSDGEATM